MNSSHTQIRDQQKEVWNKFSGGWQKWNQFAMNWLSPVGKEIIANLHLTENDQVLDIAAGTGEPGLSIAKIVKNGKVIVTDLSDDMLVHARVNAREMGIYNFDTQACDVCELPFLENSFDALSCRFGFMFFPDMQIAADEMARVTKPGGRVATSVWNIPERNLWITAIMGTIAKNMELPAPPHNAPGMFRCAKPGFIEEVFKNAGLKNVGSSEVSFTLNAGDPDTYWSFMNEVAAPVVAALAKADNETTQKIKTEVYKLLHDRFPEGNMSIPCSAIVIYGEK
ncbi:MAG: class I SAM-dependent methyltransferase [Gemmatimonadaceae bacterium]|nr:class I SAM-dependent methyltransferase [Chitinophagaceae bacterium]